MIDFKCLTGATELNGLLFLPPCPLCNVIKDNSFCCWQTNALERLSQVTVGHTIRTVKLHLNVTYQEQAFTFIRTIFIFCPKRVTWLSLSKKWVVDGEIFCSGRAKAKLWLSVKITWKRDFILCLLCKLKLLLWRLWTVISILFYVTFNVGEQSHSVLSLMWH